MKVENVDVWGLKHAIRGMRNPMNSWDKSDSNHCDDMDCDECPFNFDEHDGCTAICTNSTDELYIVGKNDLGLMRKLYNGGSEHRKYLRQIFVSMDITAPLYWWKEFDTYKVGTVANSCSTMHKIHAKEFTFDDFSHDKLSEYSKECLHHTINVLNHYRDAFLNLDNKNYWWQMIQLLPSSYNQKRTVTMNYENVMNMIHQRENHKLDEWREFTRILLNLPYVLEIRSR